MNCPKCGDKVNMNAGHVCLTGNDKLKERITYLQARIAEMGKPILCAKCNDHIIADDGAVCEICAETMDTIITELQTRIAELEKLNSAALEQLSKYACPPDRNNYGQPCNDSDDCVACWREYLGARLRLMCSAPPEEQ
jgi:hypothetical protein